MDLEDHDLQNLANPFPPTLTSNKRATTVVLRVIKFYKSYRAVVRAKVALWRSPPIMKSDGRNNVSVISQYLAIYSWLSVTEIRNATFC